MEQGASYNLAMKDGMKLKDEFVSPTLCVIGHIGPLTNDEIAALPDDELAEYLKENGYYEAKRAALEDQQRMAEK